jgi:hypothetical protein
MALQLDHAGHQAGLRGDRIPVGNLPQRSEGLIRPALQLFDPRPNHPVLSGQAIMALEPGQRHGTSRAPIGSEVRMHPRPDGCWSPHALSRNGPERAGQSQAGQGQPEAHWTRDPPERRRGFHRRHHPGSITPGNPGSNRLGVRSRRRAPGSAVRSGYGWGGTFPPGPVLFGITLGFWNSFAASAGGAGGGSPGFGGGNPASPPQPINQAATRPGASQEPIRVLFFMLGMSCSRAVPEPGIRGSIAGGCTPARAQNPIRRRSRRRPYSAAPRVVGRAAMSRPASPSSDAVSGPQYESELITSF